MYRVGIELPLNFLPQFVWLRDLKWFDGPLLSEFRTSSGDSYLFHWCDFDSQLSSDRWIVFRAQKRDLIRLTNQMLALRELILEVVSEPVYVVDTVDNYTPVSATVAVAKELPPDYLPRTNSMLDMDLFVDRPTDHFHLLLDGNWDSEDFTTLTRKIRDTHSLVHDFTSGGGQAFRDHPYRGGYSIVHFFNEARTRAGPSAARLDAVQYNSPGYIRFSGDPDAAQFVGRSVHTYLRRMKAVQALNREIGDFLRSRKLNTEYTIFLSDEDESRLIRTSSQLLEMIEGPTWAWLERRCETTFAATKIARAYFTRIDELAKFVILGRLEFVKG